MTEKQHARISPSRLERIFSCPGSLLLEESMGGYSPSSEHAERGTSLHNKAHAALLHGDSVLESEDDALIASFIKECRYYQSAYPMATVGFEERIDYNDEQWGWPDFYLVEEEENLIIVGDYKSGYQKVFIQDNPQLLGYGLYISKKFNMPNAKLLTFVAQEGEPATWFYANKELRKFEKTLLKKVEQAKRSRKYALGNWCQFCKAKTKCPQQKMMLAKVNILTKPRTRTEEEVLDTVLKNKDKILALVKAAETRGLHLAKAGLLPDWQVVDKIGNRRWIDEKEATEKLEKISDDIYNIKLKSPAQMEKVIGKNIIAELVERPVTGEKLVRVNEKLIEYKE